jgi:hypothetical protein
MKMVLSA